MEVRYYTSENGLYFTVGKSVPDYLFNGDKAEPTHRKGWYCIVGASSIMSVQKDGGSAYANYRWELIDKDLTKLGAPLIISLEDSKEYEDDDYDWCIGADIKFKNMYRRKCDLVAVGLVDVEFTTKHLGHIESVLLEGTKVESYKVMSKTGWHDRNWVPPAVDLASIVNYSEIVEMLCSPLTIHNQPCSISPQTTYEIIRNYVKDNILSKYAKVTSDYDFCFTVTKTVPIKPIHIKTEIKKLNGRSYAKPKYRHRTQDNKQFIIFEMAPKPYNSHPVISGFRGESLQDLAENVRLYLEDLIETINKPLEECSVCNATGHIINSIK